MFYSIKTSLGFENRHGLLSLPLEAPNHTPWSVINIMLNGFERMMQGFMFVMHSASLRGRMVAHRNQVVVGDDVVSSSCDQMGQDVLEGPRQDELVDSGGRSHRGLSQFGKFRMHESPSFRVLACLFDFGHIDHSPASRQSPFRCINSWDNVGPFSVQGPKH